MASKAQKPDGLVIVTEKEIPRFLENMPVEKIPGIGPRISRYLDSMGVATCGQLRKIKKSALAGRYGKYGLWLYEIARGRDSDFVTLYAEKGEPPKSVGHSYTLPRTVYRRDILRAWIRLLAEMVAVRLRRYELEGKITHFYMRQDAAFEWAARQKNFSAYTVNGEEIYARCMFILDTFDGKRLAVRALGVSVSALRRAQKNYLFEEDLKKRKIVQALDAVNDRFGEWTLYPAVLSLTRS